MKPPRLESLKQQLRTPGLVGVIARDPRYGEEPTRKMSAFQAALKKMQCQQDKE